MFLRSLVIYASTGTPRAAHERSDLAGSLGLRSLFRLRNRTSGGEQSRGKRRKAPASLERACPAPSLPPPLGLGMQGGAASHPLVLVRPCAQLPASHVCWLCRFTRSGIGPLMAAAAPQMPGGPAGEAMPHIAAHMAGRQAASAASPSTDAKQPASPPARPARRHEDPETITLPMHRALELLRALAAADSALVALRAAAAAGLPVGLADSGNTTALHAAASLGDTAAVSNLLAAGADPNLEASSGLLCLR